MPFRVAEPVAACLTTAILVADMSPKVDEPVAECFTRAVPVAVMPPRDAEATTTELTAAVAVADKPPKVAEPVATCFTKAVLEADKSPKVAEHVAVCFTRAVTEAVIAPKVAEPVAVTNVANGVTISLLVVLKPSVTARATIVSEFLNLYSIRNLSPEAQVPKFNEVNEYVFVPALKVCSADAVPLVCATPDELTLVRDTAPRMLLLPV